MASRRTAGSTISRSAASSRPGVPRRGETTAPRFAMQDVPRTTGPSSGGDGVTEEEEPRGEHSIRMTGTGSPARHSAAAARPSYDGGTARRLPHRAGGPSVEWVRGQKSTSASASRAIRSVVPAKATRLVVEKRTAEDLTERMRLRTRPRARAGIARSRRISLSARLERGALSVRCTRRRMPSTRGATFAAALNDHLPALRVEKRAIADPASRENFIGESSPPPAARVRGRRPRSAELWRFLGAQLTLMAHATEIRGAGRLVARAEARAIADYGARHEARAVRATRGRTRTAAARGGFVRVSSRRRAREFEVVDDYVAASSRSSYRHADQASRASLEVAWMLAQHTSPAPKE